MYIYIMNIGIHWYIYNILQLVFNADMLIYIPTL